MMQTQPAAANAAERVFHALGDPTRRAIIARLGRGPQSVSALAAPLGVTVTAIGQHVSVLESSGLVRTHKLGRVRTCRIEAAGFSVLETWLNMQRSIWAERFDRLEDVLDEDD